MKKTTPLLFFLFFSSTGFSQNCAVEMQSLKGTYTGDCKKGKATGKGKASGTDMYDGEFKSGLPDGEGIYTWSNGNRFTGTFSAGLKEGKGTMVYKRQNAADSIVNGYWKMDLYAGINREPYRIIYKSKKVNEVDVEYKQDGYKKIVFVITNTSGGGLFIDGTEMVRAKVDEVQLLTGAYGRLFINDNHAKKTESILEDVIFPIRFKAIIGEEEIEMEFREAGNYTITLRIND